MPPSNDIITNLGHIHLQQGRYVDAIRIYENVLKSIPNMPCSTHSSQNSSNLSKPASKELTLRHVPTASYAAISDCLSLAHFKHKQHEGAISVQLKSLHLDPSQIHVWYNLAYTKEEFAVASLLKPHKTAQDIKVSGCPTPQYDV
jgi:tetratricopeptide (TPR) repeat protein